MKKIELPVRPRKLRQILISMFVGAVIVFGLYVVLLFSASTSKAGPQQCTNAQPYPDSPYNICTGYGQTCPKWVCAYEPDTPGRFDINGDYTPRRG